MCPQTTNVLSLRESGQENVKLGLANFQIWLFLQWSLWLRESSQTTFQVQLQKQKSDNSISFIYLKLNSCECLIRNLLIWKYSPALCSNKFKSKPSLWLCSGDKKLLVLRAFINTRPTIAAIFDSAGSQSQPETDVIKNWELSIQITAATTV